MMKSPKANFDRFYSVYSPTAYVNYLIGELNYELPFQTIEAISHYIQRLTSSPPIQVTIVGSAHGLDVVALKYDMTSEEILARWTNEATVRQPFPAVGSDYEITLIDIEPEPLRFASDVNLSDKSFVANLSASFSEPLEQHFREMTDIIIATGVISYLGVDGLDRLIQTAFVKGKAKLLSFSALKFLDTNAYIKICLKHGLLVRKLIESPHRSYKNEIEKQRVKQVLKSQDMLSEEDESGLAGYVFLAYKPELAA